MSPAIQEYLLRESGGRRGQFSILSEGADSWILDFVHWSVDDALVVTSEGMVSFRRSGRWRFKCEIMLADGAVARVTTGSRMRKLRIALPGGAKLVLLREHASRIFGGEIGEVGVFVEGRMDSSQLQELQSGDICSIRIEGKIKTSVRTLVTVLALFFGYIALESSVPENR